jgi:L-2-hydroxyglutarate oxidase LhgO
MLPIEKACYWMATAPIAIMPSLQESIKTDIGIVGAGFTGLWTALFLKELDPSAEVAILEKQIAGYGGSGRNGGILGETIDHSHDLAIAQQKDLYQLVNKMSMKCRSSSQNNLIVITSKVVVCLWHSRPIKLKT